LIRTLKACIPWWAKIGGKLVLSRLPLGYRFWQDLGLFRHGRMDSWRYAATVLEQHAARAGLQGRLKGARIVEIGPGDSVATALVAFSEGASAILVDAGRFASEQVAVYRRMCEQLSEAGRTAPDLGGANDLDEVINRSNAAYLTQGLQSLRRIETGSVDFIFSQAVLEHVRNDEFLETAKECRRILKPDGVCSHRIDLKDHLGGKLNNLRFSRRLWESDFFAKSGFYTNRIQYSEMLRMFAAAGFRVEVGAVNRWDVLPIDRARLAGEFRGIPDEELRVSGFDVLLRPA
jgi:predicted SAM-dependent methyltransferase